MCNCRIYKFCVRCVLGVGDLFSNLYFGVFMIVFLMINVFLVNFLERFDMGKNKNCLKYYYVVYVCVFGSVWLRGKFIYLRVYFMFLV